VHLFGLSKKVKKKDRVARPRPPVHSTFKVLLAKKLVIRLPGERGGGKSLHSEARRGSLFTLTGGGSLNGSRNRIRGLILP